MCVPSYLLLSGELIRAAEEDKRLLMPESADCFRFTVELERLSTGRERPERRYILGRWGPEMSRQWASKQG